MSAMKQKSTAQKLAKVTRRKEVITASRINLREHPIRETKIIIIILIQATNLYIGMKKTIRTSTNHEELNKRP